MQDGYNRINLNETPASALAQRPTGYIDYQGTNMRGQVERKWALGLQGPYLLVNSVHGQCFQSRAHPREIMTEVLKALQELNVCWKKIGHYNMKYRWDHGSNGMQSNNYFGDELSIVEAETTSQSHNVVKFEV
ncbi:SNF1-related protein kinase catalytic subunit alpha KIN10-like protein [Tanacetum coccineum]